MHQLETNTKDDHFVRTMDIPNKVLIVGLGTTGVGVAKFLHKLGKHITITDMKSEEELTPSLKALKGVKFVGRFGAHNEDDFLTHPLIVVSPGIDSELPYLKEAKKSGVRVIGEMELAYGYIKEPIIAITGTNGKTTTTTLIGKIFKKAYGNVFVGGNIGNPLINYVLEGKKAPYIILEVSSFQLETIEAFHPHTAILLNITEDHLDRYRSYDEYKEAKYRIFENQTERDYAVIHKNMNLGNMVKAKTFYFSIGTALEEGTYFSNGMMYVRLQGKEFVYKRELSPLVGIHNTENLLVALLSSHIYGIEKHIIEEVLRNFRGLPHRVEPVREMKGVRFINDSKATNVDAAKRALESMDTKVILIAGGKDKGGSYRTIIEFMDKIKALILIGEAKEKIMGELGGYVETYVEKDLYGAVDRAWKIAQKGDTVLFSPMCSSFDMFKDYKERGNTFKNIVGSL